MDLARRYRGKATIKRGRRNKKLEREESINLFVPLHPSVLQYAEIYFYLPQRSERYNSQKIRSLKCLKKINPITFVTKKSGIKWSKIMFPYLDVAISI